MAMKTATPPMKKSDEANQDQLEMAKAQGEAYLTTLNYMAHHEADTGGEQAAGNYVVAYAIEEAEGMYYKENGELKWRNPQEENAHIEVSVRDAADNRFVPGLTVTVTLIDSDGNEVGSHEQPFLWHPWLYHYGRNWKVPGDGQYILRVHIEAPDFPRHDKKNGLRYADPVDVTFHDVSIKTGQKISS